MAPESRLPEMGRGPLPVMLTDGWQQAAKSREDCFGVGECCSNAAPHAKNAKYGPSSSLSGVGGWFLQAGLLACYTNTHILFVCQLPYQDY